MANDMNGEGVDEERNARVPVWILCQSHRPGSPPGTIPLAIAQIEDVECLLCYRNQELAELVVAQANSSEGVTHKLLRLNTLDEVIEQLSILPHEYRHICWNKPMEAAGTFELQVIDTLLGWLIRHKRSQHLSGI